MLSKSENRLRGIIENSTNLFYSRTFDNEFTYMSPQAKQMLDMEPSLAKRDLTGLMTANPNNKAHLQKAREALMQGRKPPVYELEITTPKGRRVWGGSARNHGDQRGRQRHRDRFL